MSTLSLVEIASLLTVTPLLLIPLGLIPLLICFLFSILLPQKPLKSFFKLIALLVPIVGLSCTAFLMLDTFAYTVFSVSITYFSNWFRYFYGLLLLYFAFLIGRIVLYEKGLDYLNAKRRPLWMSLFFLMVMGCTLLGYSLKTGYSAIPPDTDFSHQKTDLQNIMLISSDGLNANRLPMYGYHRNTTPFLLDFSKNALVVENFFPNAHTTSESICSILTSKNPFTTRVLTGTDFLRGRDIFQHLPYLLKKLGYQTAEWNGTPMIGAKNWNMKSTRQEADWRNISNYVLHLVSGLFDEKLDVHIYFAQILYDRVSSRINHSFGLRLMMNPFEPIERKHSDAPVEEGVNANQKDIDQFLQLLEPLPRPFFGQIHFMGTHGSYFHPMRRTFSLGQKQNKHMMDDFFDDALYDFDDAIKQIVSFLERKGELENTVFVFFSDHPKTVEKPNVGFVVREIERVPLIIKFPKNNSPKNITQNTQGLDIAPTLLGFLGYPIPNWMEGHSLLKEKIPNDPILVSHRVVNRDARGESPLKRAMLIDLISCNQTFRYWIEEKKLVQRTIPDHTGQCEGDPIKTKAAAKKWMIDYLKRRSIDTSSFNR